MPLLVQLPSWLLQLVTDAWRGGLSADQKKRELGGVTITLRT